LRAKRGARFFVVKVGQKGIVFAIVNAAGVEAFGKDAGKGRFADPQRAFDGNETGSLRPRLGMSARLAEESCAIGEGL